MTYPTDDQVEAAAKAIFCQLHAKSFWEHASASYKNTITRYGRAALQAVFTPEFVQQMAEDKRDAERYRWLRNLDRVMDAELYVAVDSHKYPDRWALSESELDAAIDASMRKTKGGWEMNDAQRKAMEEAYEKEYGKPYSQKEPSGWTWGIAWEAALRAQLDAPAEKVEPVAFTKDDFDCAIKAATSIGRTEGMLRGEPMARHDAIAVKGLLEIIHERRVKLSTLPTPAHIEAAARAEAIEECAKVCEVKQLKIIADQSGSGKPAHAAQFAVKMLEDCTAAIRALKSSAPTDKWLPIETAPKDGTEVLLWATRYAMLNADQERIVGFFNRGWWAGNIPLSHVELYQLLPAVPVSAPTEGEKG